MTAPCVREGTNVLAQAAHPRAAACPHTRSRPKALPSSRGPAVLCRAGVAALVLACSPLLCGSVRFKVPGTVCGRYGGVVVLQQQPATR